MSSHPNSTPPPPPSRKDLAVFGLLLAVFFVLLSRMALVNPGGLLVAAVVTGTAWLISLAFNRGLPRRAQAVGLVIPGTLAVIWALRQSPAIDPKGVVWALIGFGVAWGISVNSPAWGRACYQTWMKAAGPLGWTFTRLILGAVLLLVMAPVGFILRVTGRDPMERSFDRAATTYWKPYDRRAKQSDYFRQF